MLGGYIFGPILLIFGFSIVYTPLYHVRYLSIYTPPFALIAGASIIFLIRRLKWLGVAAAVALMAISIMALQQFWYNPLYASDDHRNAVRELAYRWRPGDVILVNAGWVYTALTTYWPTHLVGPNGTLPPPITAIKRITAYEPMQSGQDKGVVLVRTGSVDGPPSLGWGDPNSDFFRVSKTATKEALGNIAANYQRIWHYRQYDTVSDPDGVIRDWLASKTLSLSQQSYPGHDYLQVGLYATDSALLPSQTAIVDAGTFGDALLLRQHTAAATSHAGEILYVNLFWQALPGLNNLQSPLAMSLRLYDKLGQMAVQADSAPQIATRKWQIGAKYRQPLALSLPADLEPGYYSLQIIVYRQTNMSALPIHNNPHVIQGQRWELGKVTLAPPTQAPAIDSIRARYDYIDLVQAAVDTEASHLGTTLHVSLVWRPNPSPYRDNYTAILELRHPDGSVAQTWSQIAGGPDYPSGMWPPGLPLREIRTLSLDASLLPGQYTLDLRMERAEDKLPIPAHTYWWLAARPSIEIGHLTILP